MKQRHDVIFCFNWQDLEDSEAAAVVQTNAGRLEELTEATSGLAGLDSSNITASHVKFTGGGVIEGETDVFYAYLILGIVAISAGLTYFMIFIATPPRNVMKTREERQKEEENDDDTKPDDPRFKVPFLMGVFVFFVSYCMLEGNYGNFLLAYAVEGLGWSKSMGATVTAVFWASFTIGRGLGNILCQGYQSSGPVRH